MVLSFSGWSTFDWPDITRALLDSVGGSFTLVTVMVTVMVSLALDGFVPVKDGSVAVTVTV